MLKKLDDIKKRYEFLSEQLADSAVIADMGTWQRYSKEQSDLTETVEKYEEYLSLQDKLTPSKEERERIVVLGEEMAILIAIEFNFEDKELEGMKEEYVEFARERLVEGTKKPYFRHMSMLYYIRALYGQTNIAFSLEGDNRKTNIATNIVLSFIGEMIFGISNGQIMADRTPYIQMFLTKNTIWDYQKEWRLLGDAEYKIKAPKIKTIYFGKNMREKYRHQLKDFCDKRRILVSS